MRELTDRMLDDAFIAMSEMKWQEIPEYYFRYRSRYDAVMRRFADLSATEPQSVLEVGGGQLAFMAHQLWSDTCTVADISEECFPALRASGLNAMKWNLARDDSPTDQTFDFVLCSEVLEHLPVPGHVALTRIWHRMNPGGYLILTTPNLYRLRNIAFLATGRPIFDHFDLPGDSGVGHVLEYSKDHLKWQVDKAGFTDYVVEMEDFEHSPHRRVDRVLSTLSAPLRQLPRLRDNLVVVARRA